LEVHHIEERATAVGGKLPDGTSMNALRNTVVACEGCHRAHHAKAIEIGSVKQTSEGPVREVRAPKVHQGVPENEMELIKNELRAYPNVSAKRMVFDLETKYGIRVTVQRLTTIRASLSNHSP
jgi:hypothetical protein